MQCIVDFAVDLVLQVRGMLREMSVVCAHLVEAGRVQVVQCTVDFVYVVGCHLFSTCTRTCGLRAAGQTGARQGWLLAGQCGVELRRGLLRHTIAPCSPMPSQPPAVQGIRRPSLPDSFGIKKNLAAHEVRAFDPLISIGEFGWSVVFSLSW